MGTGRRGQVCTLKKPVRPPVNALISSPSAERLCAVGDLLEGQVKGFAEQGVFALRFNGIFHVYQDACPHYGDTPLAWRKDAYLNADGTRIVCAAHGALFEPDTGLCVLGPCLGQSLQSVPVDLNADGSLVITKLCYSAKFNSKDHF